MRNNILVGVGALVILALSIWWAKPAWLPLEQEQQGIVCTMDAKLCPDGSYVGRVGPNCEFAACPGTTPAAGTTRVSVGLAETKSALDVSLTPVEVLEDSRCAQDVQCVWAGRVRLRTHVSSGLGTSEYEFEIGSSLTTEAEEITLVGVLPSPRSDGPILPGDYLFTFEIQKR